MNRTPRSHSSLTLNPLHYWLLSHLRALLFALGALVRTPFASLMTLAVIGVAMALPAGFYILLNNFQSLSQHWSGKPSISLYLKKNVSTNQVNTLLASLRRNPTIEQVNYISPAQGLKQFEAMTQLGNTLSLLNQNPLPGVIVITPESQAQSPTALQNLLTNLQNLPLVDTGQLDTAWVKRLYYIITLGERITYTLAILFGLGVILIIGNTIRLTMQDHRQEIAVMKLVGAQDAFIRRPLLHRGVLYGLLGGAVAWGLVSIILFWLDAPANALAQTYNNTLSLQGLSWLGGLEIMTTCALLGLLGSWLAVHHHLITRRQQ